MCHCRRLWHVTLYVCLQLYLCTPIMVGLFCPINCKAYSMGPKPQLCVTHSEGYPTRLYVRSTCENRKQMWYTTLSLILLYFYPSCSLSLPLFLSHPSLSLYHTLPLFLSHPSLSFSHTPLSPSITPSLSFSHTPLSPSLSLSYCHVSWIMFCSALCHCHFMYHVICQTVYVTSHVTTKL